MKSAETVPGGLLPPEASGNSSRADGRQTTAKAVHPAVSLSCLCKAFGGVRACDRISLDFENGQIHALLGENGSGKTSLMNILSGIYRPDSGCVRVDGRAVSIRSPREAIRLGIGMVHQHFKLVESFTARENLRVGKNGRPAAAPEELIARYGFRIDLDKKVRDLSVGEKQTVEILKVLSRGSRILILDEPTAVLAPQEIEALFDILKAMRREGHAIVIITHKLEEVLSVSDRVSVLHRGRLVGTVNTRDADRRSLTEMMVGHAVDLNIRRADTGRGPCVLSVRGLTAGGGKGRPLLKGVRFELHTGEILGVAGLAGSGQKALCDAVTGLEPLREGELFLDGQRINGLSPREIMRRGISLAYVPEDRLGTGLVGAMDIPDNLLLKRYSLQKGPVLRRSRARVQARELVGRLSISVPSLKTAVRKLSGGNVQKVLLGREISQEPRVLICAYPSRGLDIGASMTVYAMLNEQKKKGVAILFIGEDLDVLLSLCDRIMVLNGGRMAGIVEARSSDKTALGSMMLGLEGCPGGVCA